VPSADRIDQLKKRYAENPHRFFAPLANEYRKAGEFDQAISLCQLHMAEQPLTLNGHVVYGQALYDAGRSDEAKATFEAAISLDPENLIALRHLGDIARTTGASDDARVWYKRVLDADPRNEEVATLLAHLDSGAGTAYDDGEGASDSRTAYRDRPDAAPEPVAPPELSGLMDLSMDFTTDGTPAEFGGFEETRHAAPSSAAPPFVTETMAELYLKQGFASEALDVYRQLSAQSPGDENLRRRVRELERRGRSSAAHDVVPEPPGEVRRSDSAPLDDTLDVTLDATLDTSLDPNLDGTLYGPPPANLEPEETPHTVRSYFARLAARRAVKSNGRSRTATQHASPPVAAPVAASMPAPRPAPMPPPMPTPASTPTATPAAAPAPASSAPAPGGSLDLLFDGHVSSADENVALALAQVAGAVEMGLASVKGRPTAPAATELSLDSVFSVFRDAGAPAGDMVPRQSQKLRFDQFFATDDEAPAAAPAPEPAPTSAAPGGEPGSPAELQQFQSWLQGLKKP
jgi:tetratricopeptide (TPR) repeat protein